jgi:DNA-binding MarR family transcriptional regulator
MSTPFEAGRSVRGSGAAGEITATASAETLAVAATAFADTFERWASRRAFEAGASIPRLRLLNAVHCHGPQKMADLAEALAVTPRNVTALVDGLEAESMVRRVPHSTDRRVTLVELTCDADRVAAQFASYQASIAGLFADMTDTDRTTLLRLFEALRGRMHAESGCATAERQATDA